MDTIFPLEGRVYRQYYIYILTYMYSSTVPLTPVITLPQAQSGVCIYIY